MATSILASVAATPHVVYDLPIPPIGFGLITFSILMFLGVVTLSWKGIAHRH
ncbi:MAG TPA: hypothetical protein VK065_04535 [Brevibacterium sp.]|nr:hypothetical protein [Brevibacterium sp.]HLS33123.1 hypothetical protein [Brevibacterium sp.]